MEKVDVKVKKLDSSRFAGVDWSSSARYKPYGTDADTSKGNAHPRKPDSEFSRRRRRDKKSGHGVITTTTHAVTDDDAVVVLPGEVVNPLPTGTTPDSLGDSISIAHAWIGLTQTAPDEWRAAFDDIELPTETLSGGNFPLRECIGPFIRDCAKGAALALVAIMDVAVPSIDVTCAPMARGVGEHGSIGYAISAKIRAEFPSDMETRLLYTSHTEWLARQLKKTHGVTDFSASFAFRQEASTAEITIHCIVPLYIGRRIGIKETEADTWASSAEDAERIPAGGDEMLRDDDDDADDDHTPTLPTETTRATSVSDAKDLNRRARRLWERYKRKDEAGNPAYDFYRCIVSGSIEDILRLQHMDDMQLSTPSESFLGAVVSHILDCTSIRVDQNDSIGIVWRGCNSIASKDIAAITTSLSKLGIMCSVRLQVYGSSNATLAPATLVVANASYVRSLVGK